MGKSKFQAKASEKVFFSEPTLDASQNINRPKYYDEEFISSKKPGSSAPFAIFLIVTLVVAGCVVGGIVYTQNQNESENTNTTNNYTFTTTTTTTTGSTGGPVIEHGDTVELAYKLWPDFDHDGSIDYQNTSPYQDSSFETTASPNNLIYGFYVNILGLEEGEEKYFQLPANIDTNGDGYDDNTGQVVMSYGDPSHDLYNTALVFYVQVLSIN